MSEKIMTQHPRNLKGVNISRVKYDQVRQAILTSLDECNPSTFK